MCASLLGLVFVSHLVTSDEGTLQTALLELLPPDVLYETMTARSAADEATPPSL
jgi:hypothetical protein